MIVYFANKKTKQWLCISGNKEVTISVFMCPLFVRQMLRCIMIPDWWWHDAILSKKNCRFCQYWCSQENTHSSWFASSRLSPMLLILRRESITGFYMFSFYDVFIIYFFVSICSSSHELCSLTFQVPSSLFKTD